MKIQIILIAVILSIIACKKENDPNKKKPEQKFDTLTAQFVVDSFVYNEFEADMYYRLQLTGGTSPVKVIWITPYENQGIGPFYMQLSYFNYFKVLVMDTANYFNLEYNYDYRDKLVGDYKCVMQYKCLFDLTESCITKTKIDTLEVRKSGTSYIKILPKIFKPDINGSYYWEGLVSAPQTQMSFNCKFLPRFDSILVSQHYSNFGVNEYLIIHNGKKIIR